MTNPCPLPIDWLDFIETGGPDSFAAHLEDCASCQRLVASLREETKADDLGDWLSAVDLGKAVVWRPQRAESPSVGQLVLNSASYAGDDAEFDGVPRLLLLVLDEGREIDGRRWLRVAPADTDVENASSTDLLINGDETDIGVPLRILFSMQTSVSDEQLDERVGALTSSGEDVLKQAIAGELDNLRFGLPLEGPDDERLAIDRDTEDAMRLLRTPFFAAALEDKESERVVEPMEGRKHREGLGQLLVFDLSWVRAKGQQLALAAKTEPEDVVAIASLKSDFGAIEGHLRYELLRDMLFFVVDRSEGFATCEIKLVLHTKSSQEFESAPFVPLPGEEVEVGSLFAHDVEELAAKVD